MNNPSPSLFSVTLLTLLLHHALLVVSLNHNRTRVPALLAFGDSLHDPGNNNVLPTFLKSDFPPYGTDFIGHRATGRFSNGKISPDVLASYLGLKELLPAYLDPELKPEDLLTGVSFASAGTGYDVLTAETLSVLSMWDQLDLFRDYIEKLKQVAGVERAHSIISDSLYIVSGGSNDILVTYFDTTLRTWHRDVSSYVDLLIHSASNVVKELYSLGARKIGLVGLTPLGCLPFQRSFKGGIQRTCATPANQAAIKFNSKLIKEAKTFSSKLKGSRISYLNLYDPLHAVIQNPSNYGFEESSRGCCGTGKIEISFLCNDLSPHTCSNASKYAFWDSFHPSERLIEIVLAQVIKNDFPSLL
ncbi:GDSL esterase/lipase At1g59030-like isoform X2 [Aristolochia californica]|uniref:GDSL esterase/lipase At1g59030-like isoform X2 n=1 Tax=Aristolochia californica TaxID=171875 RepID=UPI0035D7269B